MRIRIHHPIQPRARRVPSMHPAWAILVSACAIAPHAYAQSLAERVLSAPTGIVRMSFPAREGVCGDWGGFPFSGQRMSRGREDSDWEHECEDGPVRVRIRKDGSRITAIRTYVGGTWRARADVTNFGDVPAQDASNWFLDLAATATPSVAEDALAPAMMADAPDPWERLLELGRDRDLSRPVRERAIFWAGQSAAREATSGLARIVDSDEDNTSVQKAAVFALSQRDEPERVDQLLRVARTHGNPEVVESAFFWLAESADARAIDFFEEVLLAGE